MRYLDDRWALITGSSRGVGQQIALGLAARRCNVIVHARSLDHTEETMALLEAYDVASHAVAGDLAAPEGVQRVIDAVNVAPNRVDILYNNAAIQNPWREIWDITRDEWLTTFQINVFAMIRLCNAFAPAMRERGYGRIVNLTSGIRDTPQLAPYSVSKAAVDKYTRDLAAELKGTNVLVNTLDPGWLKTDMGGPQAPGEVTSVLPGALVPALLDDHGPSGRFFAAQDYTMLER
jgi:NAD(P)-dependent dehydrogenase (short-subunit alcohol dehydrogenase family)